MSLPPVKDSGHTRVAISRDSALLEAALFPIPFVFMVLYFLWKVLTDGVSSFMYGFPPGFPEWGKWIVLVAFEAVMSYLCWRWTTTRQVTLVDDRLLIRGLRTSADVPLSQVQSIRWIQGERDPGGTLEARLVLAVPTAFGTEVRFEPKSHETFELLRSKIEGPPDGGPISRG